MSDINYDPYRLQRADERKAAKVAGIKERLRAASGKGASRSSSQHEPQTSIKRTLSKRAKKNSRLKGNRGELGAAEAFSAWSGEYIKRTPGSGGWGGAKEFGTTADLICKKKAFPFHVEVKHREGWMLDDLVTGARADHDKSIVMWWKQCTDSCPRKEKSRTFKKVPLLVFRRNRQPWLVMVRRVDLLNNHVIAPPERSVDYNLLDVTVMKLEDLLARWPVPQGLKAAMEDPR